MLYCAGNISVDGIDLYGPSQNSYRFSHAKSHVATPERVYMKPTSANSEIVINLLTTLLEN